MLIMFGIAKCSTVQKARAFLEEAGITYTFQDFYETKPTAELIVQWKQAHGDWPVNRAGLTFRSLKGAFDNADDALKIQLIQEKPALIRRPVLTQNGQLLMLGFAQKKYQALAATLQR